jgi:hypothetical protein
MKGIIALTLLLAACAALYAQLPPPTNLIAIEGDQYVQLEWDPPSVVLPVELNYHDGVQDGAFYQWLNQGLGVVYDLTGYPGSHPIYMDFRHSSWETTDQYDYKIHMVNFDNYETIWEGEIRTTSVLDGWELSIPVDSTWAAHLCVIVEPLSGTTEDAWPVVDYDAGLSTPTTSYLIDMTDNSIINPGVSYGDFLMNLWIQPADGRRIEAPHYVAPIEPIVRNIPMRTRTRVGPPQLDPRPTFLGYKVYRGTDPLTLDPILANEYLDLDVINNTLYNYKVTAVYTDGESDPTPVVQATPHVPANRVWIESFELSAALPTGWVTLDADGDNQNWLLVNSTSGFTAHGIGHRSALSYSYDNNAGTALTPDNYLITSAFPVPTGLSYIEYWTRVQQDLYPVEHYAVKLSMGGAEATDFTTTLFEETLHSGDWHYTRLPLDGYAGQTIRLAFEHCQCSDNFAMKIDDIALYTGVANEDRISSSRENTLSVSPNPFNPTARISYSIPEAGQVRMSVYNVKGQLVKSLVNERQTAGAHDTVWNGVDDSGKPVPSGMYFTRLSSGGGRYTSTKKMILLK